MTIYERIRKLCKKQGITITALEKELGFARGSLCKIDNHNPSAEKLQKLAMKLNVTEKYLLGMEKENTQMDIREFLYKFKNAIDKNVFLANEEELNETDKEFLKSVIHLTMVHFKK